MINKIKALLRIISILNTISVKTYLVLLVSMKRVSIKILILLANDISTLSNFIILVLIFLNSYVLIPSNLRIK
jgi:hypothetical protein